MKQKENGQESSQIKEENPKKEDKKGHQKTDLDDAKQAGKKENPDRNK